MIELIFKDITCKNIAVRLSGGPDSALVYYAVCEHYKDQDDVNIYPYTMATPLRPYAIDKAKAVIEFTEKTTGKPCAEHYTIFHNEHNKQNTQQVNDIEYVNGQEMLERRLLSEKQIDIVYYGLSLNCQFSELQRFVDSLQPIKSMKYKDAIVARDFSRDVELGPRILFIDPHYAFFPLIASDKKTVKHMYDYYNVTKTLYPLTWSCESDLQSDLETPVQCGCCYFCLEREFAFGKL